MVEDLAKADGQNDASFYLDSTTENVTEMQGLDLILGLLTDDVEDRRKKRFFYQRVGRVAEQLMRRFFLYSEWRPRITTTCSSDIMKVSDRCTAQWSLGEFWDIDRNGLLS